MLHLSHVHLYLTNIWSLGRDAKRWRWNHKGFSINSFYAFLKDGGTRCDNGNTFWKGPCPLKVKVFLWLDLQNKILTQENLLRWRCNRIFTSTYVLCNADEERKTHLLLSFRYSEWIWAYFVVLFHSSIPTSLSETWTIWGCKGLLTLNPLVFSLFEPSTWQSRPSTTDAFFLLNLQMSLLLLSKFTICSLLGFFQP